MKAFREQEDKLLTKIKANNLVRIVKHIEASEDTKFKRGVEVRLYRQDVWDTRKTLPKDEELQVCAYGEPYCYKKEKQYSKGLGRLIATGRAWKNYQLEPMI